MPKIIKNLEETLITTAKRIIEEEGYSALSMRRMAEECHVALGTIYNYVEGKDHIVAKIMMADWSRAVDKMNKAAENKKFINGYCLIYDAIAEFCESNQRTWKEYAQGGGTFTANSDMHQKLQKQVGELIKSLAQKTGNEDLADISALLAETVIAAAVQTSIPKTQFTALAKKLVVK